MEWLTQNLVQRLFDYNPTTGVLAHKNGEPAGYISDAGSGKYLKACVYSQKFFVHQLIWLYVKGNWPSMIDHIDGDSLNNCINNLREVTSQQNAANKTRLLHGVEKHGAKFRARLSKDGLRYELGSFHTREEAEAAYIKKHLEIFGEHSIYSRIA